MGTAVVRFLSVVMSLSFGSVVTARTQMVAIAFKYCVGWSVPMYTKIQISLNVVFDGGNNSTPKAFLIEGDRKQRPADCVRCFQKHDFLYLSRCSCVIHGFPHGGIEEVFEISGHVVISHRPAVQSIHQERGPGGRDSHTGPGNLCCKQHTSVADANIKADFSSFLPRASIARAACCCV